MLWDISISTERKELHVGRHVIHADVAEISYWPSFSNDKLNFSTYSTYPEKCSFKSRICVPLLLMGICTIVYMAQIFLLAELRSAPWTKNEWHVTYWRGFHTDAATGSKDTGLIHIQNLAIIHCIQTKNRLQKSEANH